MPLYEYQCTQCGKRFERIQKFSDPPVEVCPFCNGKVEKLLSSPAFQFKGSGFYITDYARKGESGKSESGESKAESKDAKTESASKSTKESPKADTGSKTESTPSSGPKKD